MKSPFYANLNPAHSGVTGSCFQLEVVFPNKPRMLALIDCGMFQGKNESMYNDMQMQPGTQNAEFMLLTHNHVDHTGRVPELVRNGFRGKIYASEPTFGLLDKAWRDCEKIERINAKRECRHPRFKMSHVTMALRQVQPIAFERRVQVHPNVWVTFLKNGHVLGSSLILMEIFDDTFEFPPINFLFTGDYNNKNRFFSVQGIPEYVKQMPLHIVCEATYGENGRQKAREPVFNQNIVEQVERGRDILIPVFAFERGQIILSNLKNLQETGRLSTDVPIFMDGTLFKEYTKHYKAVADKYFDKVQKDDFLPENAEWINKVGHRRAVLSSGGPKIIVASGGMGSFGASQAYLPSFISNPNGVIHFTGYQCEGTLGRKLQIANETQSPLVFGGKVVRVDCSVIFTEEFSSHTLRNELLEFIKQFSCKKSILLNHGSYKAKRDVAEAIVNNFIANEVAIAERGNRYRYSPYKLEKVIRENSSNVS